MAKLGDALTESWREFQVDGPKVQKALSPKDFNLVLGTDSRLEPLDLSDLLGSYREIISFK